MNEQSKTPLTDAARDYTSPEKMDRLCQSLELAANAMERVLNEVMNLSIEDRIIEVRSTAEAALAEFEKLKNQQP